MSDFPWEIFTSKSLLKLHMFQRGDIYREFFIKDLDLIVKFVSFKLINLCKNQGYRLCKMSDFPW